MPSIGIVFPVAFRKRLWSKCAWSVEILVLEEAILSSTPSALRGIAMTIKAIAMKIYFLIISFLR